MKKSFILLVLGAAFFAAPVMAEDGKALYNNKGCAACHGEAGASLAPTFPKLKGQHAGYLAQQAAYIRDGKRTNSGASMMKGAVAGVTDAEFMAIGEYLAAQ